MTGKERMRAALGGGRPDRVPIALIGEHSEITPTDPRGPFRFDLARYGDYDSAVASLVATSRMYPGNDVISAMGAALDRFRSRRMDRTPFRLEVRDGRLIAVHRQTGEVMRTERDGGRLLAVGAGGSQEILPPDRQNFRKPYVDLQTTRDVQRHFYPVVSLEQMREMGLYDFIGDAARMLGEAFVMVGGFGIVCQALPHVAGRLDVGGEGAIKAYSAMIERPAFFHSVCQAVLDGQLPAVRRLGEVGADAVVVSGYWDSCEMVSPSHWREFSKPYVARLIEEIHAAGMRAIFWAAGYHVPVAVDLFEIGVDGLLAEPSRKGCDNSPGAYRRQVGPGRCLGGWVGELDLVRNDQQSIERTVREQIDSAGRDGNIIFCGTYLTADSAPAAVDFMCRTIVRGGGST